MKRQGFEYFLNAVYYWTWRKNIWMQRTVEKIIPFLMLSIAKLLLPKKYFEKFKNHITKNLEAGRSSFYDNRNGVCISMTRYDSQMLITIYSLCIVLPASLAIAINTEQLWTGFLVIVPILYINDKILSEYVCKDDKYLKYFEEFEKEDKTWRIKWRAITIIVWLGIVLVVLFIYEALKLVFLYS